MQANRLKEDTSQHNVKKHGYSVGLLLAASTHAGIPFHNVIHSHVES